MPGTLRFSDVLEVESVMNNDKVKAPILRLVARDGERVPMADVAPIDAPEATLVVSFAGLTEAEQRRALAAFPGGKRFRLVTETESERAAG